MAKEASVAPRERFNIVYLPSAGDAQEEVELPLKIFVMGAFFTLSLVGKLDKE